MGSILMSLLQMGLALPIRHLRLRHCYGFVLLVPFCSLLAWEQLRHALLKANHYWLQLMQIVVMVLTFLGVVVAVIPSDTAQMVHGTSLLGGFAKFQLAFPFYNNMAIGIVNLCLGIGIAQLFGGRVRLYGIGLAVLPVLSMLVGEFYTYLYTSVGGLTLQALDTYRITMLVVQFVLQLVLWVLMYRLLLQPTISWSGECGFCCCAPYYLLGKRYAFECEKYIYKHTIIPFKVNKKIVISV